MAYTEGQKVIVNRGGNLQIEWVSSSRLYNSIAASMTRTTNHQKDAEDGRGAWTNNSEIQPYSENLWAAYLDLLKRQTTARLQFEIELKQLRQGKIPQRELWQGI